MIFASIIVSDCFRSLNFFKNYKDFEKNTTTVSEMTIENVMYDFY